MASVEQHNTLDEPENKKQKKVQMSSSVDVKAETGATVNAPVLTGNTITGPVTSNTAGNEPQKTLVTETLEKQLKQDYHQFTLDPNTVHDRLRLSEENREITYTNISHSYPDHPDRFDDDCQVLCRESVCGRCYWEVEWSGSSVYIAVSYKSISRKGSGTECVFGYNEQSWSLECYPYSFSFTHNGIETALPAEPISSGTALCVNYRRVGVYVDHSAGTLSFYSIDGDTMSLIHTVQTTFTQPLYPGFRVDRKSSVKLMNENRL